MKNGNFSLTADDFKYSLSDLKDKMNKLLKMCDSTDFKQNEAYDTLQEGLVNLLDFKNCNAIIQKDIEYFKDLTNKEKEIVESKNLNLQNYTYQKENILSQINACVHFPTHQIDKIKLPEKEEVHIFYQLKGLNKDEIERKDKLECELEARKFLDLKVDELKKEKENKKVNLKEKEKFIETLPEYFANLETDTIKAQRFLKLNISESNENILLAEKLPPPLYVIYNSFACVGEKVKVKIVGKAESVEEYNLTYQKEFLNKEEKQKQKLKESSKEEGEHSDDGEIKDDETYNNNENSSGLYKLKLLKRRKKNETKLENKINNKNFNLGNLKNSKLHKFPLSVNLVIKSNEENKKLDVVVKFSYIPILNIVMVDLESKLPYFNTDSLLSNLFMPPNNLTADLRNKIETSICEMCVDVSPSERFYDFVQILSNNATYDLKKLLKESLSKQHSLSDEYYLDDPKKITVDNFLDSLMERIKNLPHLFHQLESINLSNKIPSEISSVINNNKKFKFVKERTFITSFNQISQAEFYEVYFKTFDAEEENNLTSIFETDEDGNFVKKFVKLTNVVYTEREALYYKINFERKVNSEKIILEAYAEIGFDYPTNNPKFILKLENEKEFNTLNIPENMRNKINPELRDFESQYSNSINQNDLAPALRDIEKEVNWYSYELCPLNDYTNLLSYQLRNISLCLDILFEIELSKDSLAYRKSQKGRFKKRPFNFNTEINLFEAR